MNQTEEIATAHDSEVLFQGIKLPNQVGEVCYVHNLSHLFSQKQARKCSIKKNFLKVSPNLQKNTCVGVFF